MRRVLPVSLFALAATAAGFMLAMQPESRPADTKPASQPAGQPGERGPGRARGTGTDFADVEQAMKALNAGMRALKNSLDDASKKTDNLTTVTRMQHAAVFSKNRKPDHLKGGDASLDAYRKTLIDLTRALLDLETQILEGKAADAKATLAKLSEMQDKGHEQFIDEGGDQKPAEPKKEDKK
jgi:soluble cytochrome b562